MISVPENWKKFGEIYTDEAFSTVFVCSNCMKNATKFEDLFTSNNAYTFWKHVEEKHMDSCNLVKTNTSVRKGRKCKSKSPIQETPTKNARMQDIIVIDSDDDEIDVKRNRNNNYINNINTENARRTDSDEISINENSKMKSQNEILIKNNTMEPPLDSKSVFPEEYDEMAMIEKEMAGNLEIFQPITPPPNVDEITMIEKEMAVNIEEFQSITPPPNVIEADEEDIKTEKIYEIFCARKYEDYKIIAEHIDLSDDEEEVYESSDNLSSKSGSSTYENIVPTWDECSFICPFCKQNFESDSELSEHIKNHTAIDLLNQKKNLSTVNGKYLPLLESNSDLFPNSHLQCSFCHKTFCQPWQVVRHELIHSGRRRSSSSKVSKETNIKKSDHQEARQFKCGQCIVATKTEQALILHKYRFHSFGCDKNTQKCEICAQLVVKEKCTEHKLMHTGKTFYRCKVCESFYINKKKLNNHIRTKHSDIVSLLQTTRECPPFYQDQQYSNSCTQTQSKSLQPQPASWQEPQISTQPLKAYFQQPLTS